MIHKKTISVEAPANIAFVKYWGKQGRQMPINPSVSMTLKECVTRCQIEYEDFKEGPILESYQFEGAENEAFRNRIEKYLNDIIDIYPLLENLKLSIKTENTFPHSAGIASSASAFAAIGYALAQIEKSENIDKRASELARLGSGSASRSVTGPYMMWGDFEEEASTDGYAIAIEDIHLDFHNLKDAVLLIDQNEKKISSSAGHAMMDTHPFRENRIKQANQHTKKILKAMREGDWELFGNILETEALTLHAMMMTSSPSYLLLAPNTLAAIEKIRDYRKKTSISAYFTIDAGPNIHLIYLQKDEESVESFIKQNLTDLCHDGRIIFDQCGAGARVTASGSSDE